MKIKTEARNLKDVLKEAEIQIEKEKKEHLQNSEKIKILVYLCNLEIIM